jgi:hypothetical protein
MASTGTGRFEFGRNFRFPLLFRVNATAPGNRVENSGRFSRPFLEMHLSLVYQDSTAIFAFRARRRTGAGRVQFVCRRMRWSVRTSPPPLLPPSPRLRRTKCVHFTRRSFGVGGPGHLPTRSAHGRGNLMSAFSAFLPCAKRGGGACAAGGGGSADRHARPARRCSASPDAVSIFTMSKSMSRESAPHPCICEGELLGSVRTRNVRENEKFANNLGRLERPFRLHGHRRNFAGIPLPDFPIASAAVRRRPDW